MKAWCLVLACVGCEKGDTTETSAAAPVSTKIRAAPTDPARIAGAWDYRTESNCGTAGVGTVRFRFDRERGVYREDGDVTWPETPLTIRWWGDGRFDEKARTLTATIDNSLGDKVTGTWHLEDDGPDKLTLDWNQTNGCHGRGIATRKR